MQNVVENRLLREQMTSTITTSENALRNINEKMDIIARTNSGRRVRQTGQNVQKVPKCCSVSKTVKRQCNVVKSRLKDTV